MSPLSINTIVGGLFNFLGNRNERKRAKDQLKSKLQLAQKNIDRNIALSDSEWELLNVKGLDNSWKDEYVTLIFTAPIVCGIIGAIFQAFGYGQFAQAFNDMFQMFNDVGIPLGTISTIVVCAAVGYKAFK